MAVREKEIGKRYEAYTRDVPAKEAVFAPFPEGLDEEICDRLKARGVKALYTHQAAMFEAAARGENAVITTATASGKTLAFLLPVIQRILKEPETRAIFLYPTKALALDQCRQIRAFTDGFGEDRIAVGVLDGDTPSTERTRVRNTCNIILTNPEMVNFSFLPGHSRKGISFIFSHLAFVVTDELHYYRGAFGSHLANIFRRLQRICRYYGSDPQYFCASATIANPGELAETVTGKPFTVIDNDGAPSGAKHYHLLQPPVVGLNDIRLPASRVASGLIPEMTAAGLSFLAFAKSRRSVEVILKEARDVLKPSDMDPRDLSDRIRGYRGGYSAAERREIARAMVDGHLKGLITTNALELGIDIGQVERALIIGYPGTRASFFQQAGRAGRSGKDAHIYLILDDRAFDQYIAVDPDWLFDTGSESAIVDPNNLYIELAHVRAAAAELPLTMDDAALFPDLGEILPVLSAHGEVRMQGGSFLWVGAEFPQGDYSLRNADPSRVSLINKETGEVITEMDQVQAMREAYEGAVYLHEGAPYYVLKYDRALRRAEAVPTDEAYYTAPLGSNELRILREREAEETGQTVNRLGDVRVTDTVNGFKKLKFRTHENLGTGEVVPPLVSSYETVACYLDIPKEVSRVFYRLEAKEAGESGDSYMGMTYFESMAYAIRNAALLDIMGDESDVAYGIIRYDEEDAQSVAVGMYDLYTGGLGFAERIHDRAPEIVKRAHALVKGCPCKSGCVACVGDYRRNKAAVVWGLASMTEQTPLPKSVVLGGEEKPLPPLKKKPCRLEELPAKWEELTSLMKDRNEVFAVWLTTVKQVSLAGNSLVLLVNSDFLRDWVRNAANREKLTELVARYVQVPAGFSVTAEKRDGSGDDGEDRRRTRIEKRLSDMEERKQ